MNRRCSLLSGSRSHSAITSGSVPRALRISKMVEESSSLVDVISRKKR